MRSFLICLLVLMALAQASAAPASVVRPIDQQLMEAIWRGEINNVRLLALLGADVNAHIGYHGRTPLMEAAKRKDNADVVEFLVDCGARVNAADEDGETALMAAADAGVTGNIDLLLKLGANLEQKDTDGKTALFHATDHISALRDLLGHHANVHAKAKDGSQPLHDAVATGKLDCVKALVQAGADVSARDHDGMTAFGAIFYHNLDLIKYLIDKGADPNTIQDEHPAWTQLLSFPEGVAYLLAHGADVNAHDRDGWTSLHLAAKYEDGKMARLLITHGAKVNAKTASKDTPFSIAAQRRDDDYEREAIVAALIQAGAKDAHVLPRKRDIVLAPDSDEVAVIRALVSGGSRDDTTYFILNQDTVSGPDAAAHLHPERQTASAKKFRKDLEQKLRPEMIAAFINSRAPSKVIPPLDNTPGVVYARDRMLFDAGQGNRVAPEIRSKLLGASGTDTVSSPVFDKEHRHALIYCANRGGVLILFEKADNNWVAINSVQIWFT